MTINGTKITKDMTIGDVLEKNSDKAMKLSEVMTSFGLHCVGCGAATFETLEQGVKVHGMDDKKLDELVEKLNDVLTNSDLNNVENKTFVKLTSKALEKVKEIMHEEKKESGFLRIGVLSGGCAGYTYDLNIVDSSDEKDISFEQEGIKIIIDKDSASLLEGVEIDYIDTLKESGFKFENPNSEGGCGCGKSFN